MGFFYDYVPVVPTGRTAFINFVNGTVYDVSQFEGFTMWVVLRETDVKLSKGDTEYLNRSIDLTIPDGPNPIIFSSNSTLMVTGENCGSSGTYQFSWFPPSYAVP